eukprot:TRINITY_DN1075_c0_g1_i2.p1 TRINITY_DN1075_c0_g1~~TRINITY_DN1075_c0_g1_i2.p1  ORF type:complete len:337 (+),score=79.62 TRINITY_DN1075_c0_g1_i2:284-1294(+)
MGACISKPDESPLVEEIPPQESQQSDVVYKLLFLGSGESGKSTFFKRMQIRYGAGFSEEERANYTPTVFENTISSMKTLIKQSAILEEEFECAISQENERAAKFVLELKEEDATIDRQVAEAICTLWADKGIKNTFTHRSRFQCPDSANYFFNRVMALCVDDYIPTETDVLRCRDRTTGIVQQRFEIENNKFHVFDVGGQRAERKKWINCFKNVKAVLFVVAIAEYDQLCFEDEVTNRLEEALGVFDNVCNSKWFENTPIILLLNKTDLFREKICQRRIPLSVCFKDYNGPRGEYQPACDFIEKKFVEKNVTQKKYIHISCVPRERRTRFRRYLCQ